MNLNNLILENVGCAEKTTQFRMFGGFCGKQINENIKNIIIGIYFIDAFLCNIIIYFRQLSLKLYGKMG